MLPLKKHRIIKLFYSLIIVMVISACAYKPMLTKPAIQLPSYPQYYPVIETQAHTNWWQAYGSEELTQLFDELALSNFELNSAALRISQANALLGQQRADNWPSLDTQLSTRNTRDVDSNKDQHSSGLQFSAGYEVDLWGSRSAAQFSAELSVVIQQQEFQSLQLQLQASLAQHYFALLTQRARYSIAQQNLQASEALLAIIQHRFDAGSASGIELNQQRNTQLATQAQLLTIERSIVTYERTLAVLLGRETLNVSSLKGVLKAITLPAVNTIQPAALLSSRPDILLAESQWRLSEAEHYQAKQKRWPILSLSAGMSLDDVLGSGENWLASIASSLTAPLFDAGRIRNHIASAQAEVSINEINYRKTVVIAMQDTLENLSELAYQDKLFSVRQQEFVNNQRLYELAKLRYDTGDTDFINLLTAQRSWFSARDNLTQAKNDQLLASVNIFRAMGSAPLLSNSRTLLDQY